MYNFRKKLIPDSKNKPEKNKAGTERQVMNYFISLIDSSFT